MGRFAHCSGLLDSRTWNINSAFWAHCMQEADEDDISKSLKSIEEASRALPGYCEAVNAHSAEFSSELVARMRANIRMMKKIHSFLEWRSHNPLPRPRLRPGTDD